MTGRAPRGGRGPSRSWSRRSWTSTRQGTPAKDISAATSAPADSAASSSPSRAGSADARDRGQLAGVLEVSPEVLGGRRSENSAGSVGALGPSRSQCSDSSRQQLPPSSAAGARRSRWWPRRRSWQRCTRTPAASSGGYHRAVSSHTQRGASPRAPDVRRQVARRQLGGLPGLDRQHPFTRQARERDPGHGHMLSAVALGKDWSPRQGGHLPGDRAIGDRSRRPEPREAHVEAGRGDHLSVGRPFKSRREAEAAQRPRSSKVRRPLAIDPHSPQRQPIGPELGPAHGVVGGRVGHGSEPR